MEQDLAKLRSQIEERYKQLKADYGSVDPANKIEAWNSAASMALLPNKYIKGVERILDTEAGKIEAHLLERLQKEDFGKWQAIRLRMRAEDEAMDQKRKKAVQEYEQCQSKLKAGLAANIASNLPTLKLDYVKKFEKQKGDLTAAKNKVRNACAAMFVFGIILLIVGIILLVVTKSVAGYVLIGCGASIAVVAYPLYVFRTRSVRKQLLELKLASDDSIKQELLDIDYNKHRNDCKLSEY